MAEVSAELLSIRQTLEAQDRIDAERRKVDDAREEAASKAREALLERVDKHGIRTTTLETMWAAFFGPNGAFALVLKQLDSQGAQNKWILGLLITTLIGVVVSLATKH